MRYGKKGYFHINYPLDQRSNNVNTPLPAATGRGNGYGGFYDDY